MSACLLRWSLVHIAVDRSENLYFDYHHTAADTLDKVDPQELRENIAVVSVLAYALATMKQDLPRQQISLPEWLK